MRLTTKQKEAALAMRPGAKLVRIHGEWCAVWKENKAWLAERISSIDSEGRIWWTMRTSRKTRHLVVEALEEWIFEETS